MMIVKLAHAALMKPELDYRLAVTGKQRDESFAAIDRRMDRLRGDLDKVDSKVVSRAENKDRWEAEDKRFDALERQFDEHIRAFNDRQQRRIDAMESATRR